MMEHKESKKKKDKLRIYDETLEWSSFVEV